jgi:hypothetical protein
MPAKNYEETVRALLAKAAVTEFQEEREAFEAKAFKLLQAHSIDPASLQENPGDMAAHEDIVFDAPYAVSKQRLFSSVAKGLSCKIVQVNSRENGTKSFVFGYKSDIQKVKFLYSLLANQAFYDVTNAVVPNGEHAKTFRVRFFDGFGDKIRERLTQTQEQVVREVTGSGIVLRDKALAVLEDRDKMFPHPRKSTRYVRKSSGYGAGQAAGANARMHQSSGISNQRALGR